MAILGLAVSWEMGSLSMVIPLSMCIVGMSQLLSKSKLRISRRIRLLILFPNVPPACPYTSPSTSPHKHNNNYTKTQNKTKIPTPILSPTLLLLPRLPVPQPTPILSPTTSRYQKATQNSCNYPNLQAMAVINHTHLQTTNNNNK